MKEQEQAEAEATMFTAGQVPPIFQEFNVAVAKATHLGFRKELPGISFKQILECSIRECMHVSHLVSSGLPYLACLSFTKSLTLLVLFQDVFRLSMLYQRMRD